MFHKNKYKFTGKEQPSLVVIGNHTQGLGIIRSAAESKIPIFLLNDLAISSSRYSKYLTRYIKIPNGTIKKLAHVNRCEELTSTLLNLPVVYPSILMGINEDIINFLYTNKEELSKKYFIPDNPYNLIFDKYIFNCLLESPHRVPTFLVKDVSINEYFTDEYILKSRIGNKLRNFSNEKAIKLNRISESVLESIFNNFSNEELIVQKIIKSNHPVKSSCAFSIDGEIVGLFQYEKIRQHPNQFGTGTYLRSLFDEKMLEISQSILSKLHYTGISEIEFILDESDNSYKVIEMNPRTWKSINFAAQCGQNLVGRYIDFVFGKRRTPSMKYETDYFWVDLFTDIPQMFRERRLFNYSTKKLFECMWSLKDPLPFLSTIFFSPYLLIKKALS